MEHPVKIEIIQNDLTDFFPFRFYIEQYRDFVQEFKKGKKTVMNKITESPLYQFNFLQNHTSVKKSVAMSSNNNINFFYFFGDPCVHSNTRMPNSNNDVDTNDSCQITCAFSNIFDFIVEDKFRRWIWVPVKKKFCWIQ